MDIDCNPVSPTQQYAADQFATNAAPLSHCRRSTTPSPMNFDYLNALNASGRQSANAAPATGAMSRSSAMAAAVAAAASMKAHQKALHDGRQPPQFYLADVNEIGYNASSLPASGGINSGAAAFTASISQGFVDDRVSDSREADNMSELFVTALDNLDACVEKFRKEAMSLQEKRDCLLLSIDVMKSHDMLGTMMEGEREEINSYIQRMNARLSTVELNVRTVRDRSQEDALSQINALIDAMITIGDPTLSRQRCQQYLNSCCSSSESHSDQGGGCYASSSSGSSHAERDIGPVDKNFESALLGCTLDDQKNVKKRLQALMVYLNKQTILMH